MLGSKGKVSRPTVLGRHVDGETTSFYVQIRRFVIEYGWNGLISDPVIRVPTTRFAVRDRSHRWAHEKDD